MTADIPQELLDRIIDNLSLDQASLRSCSLVNSQWRSRSQQHLFHRMHIRVGPPGPNGPTGLLLPLPKPADNEDPDKEPEHHLEHVRTLLIHCYTAASKDLQPLLDLGLGQIEYLFILLSLNLSDPYVRGMFGKFNTVTNLYLTRSRIDSIRDISKLISGLPALEEITLRGWTGTPDYETGSEDGKLTSPLSNFHTLNLDWWGVRRAPDVVAWFTDNLECFPKLNRVRMYDVTQLEKLSAFLLKMGRALRHLELSLATADDGVFTSRGLQLNENKCLESVSVQTGDNIVQFGELILSVKQLEHLKEIVLTAIRVAQVEGVRHTSWSMVDVRLASKLFKPKLERLVIRATKSPLDMERIETILPKFTAAGGRVEPVGYYDPLRRMWGDVSVRKMWGDEGYMERLDNVID